MRFKTHSITSHRLSFYFIHPHLVHKKIEWVFRYFISCSAQPVYKTVFRNVITITYRIKYFVSTLKKERGVCYFKLLNRQGVRPKFSSVWLPIYRRSLRCRNPCGSDGVYRWGCCYHGPCCSCGLSHCSPVLAALGAPKSIRESQNLEFELFRPAHPAGIRYCAMTLLQCARLLT